MNTLRWFFVAVIAASFSVATIAQPKSPIRTAPQPALNGVAFGASLGAPMMVSASDYFYNYSDYNPAGLGLRYGIAGALRMRIAGIDKTNPTFAIIADARYTTLWHSTAATPTSSTTSNARYGMLSFGFGLEQALGSGRTQPFFGLTVDVNAIEPGTVSSTTLTASGYHTVSNNLAGDIWQLRFGVTPRMGIRAMLSRQLAFDVTAAYQIVNILNRADNTPKNYLLDEHGRESLLTSASISLGIMYTMPMAGVAKKK